MRPSDAVRRFLREQNIAGCRVTAALSGGADSICLLDTLLRLREEFALTVDAVHVQHHLRGEESRRDEEFCRSFCRERGVSLLVVSCDVKAYAAEYRCSLETAARECRYAAFAEHCSGYVATAHTASDQLETILFRMARGTGLRGLCGIPPVRGKFLRPLLRVTREEIETALREQGISYVTDSTNLEETCSRNVLRHHAVPAMRQCNPSAEHRTAEMTELLREEQDYLSLRAEEALAACRRPDGSFQGLAEYHPAIRRRCIARVLEEQGVPAGLRSILDVESLLEKGGSLELVRGGIRAHVSRGNLFFLPEETGVRRTPLVLGENRIFPAVLVEAQRIDREDAEKFEIIHTMFANCVLDYDIIKGCAELHSRTPGLYLEGAGHRIQIKKWLNECVAPAKRPYVHYLSDGEGLLWAEGLGAAKRAAVTPETRRMLYLRICHETNT